MTEPEVIIKFFARDTMWVGLCNNCFLVMQKMANLLEGVVFPLVLLQLAACGYSLDAKGDSIITCKSQQEACTCDENRNECHFQLKVERVQTFTSYKYRENEGELLVRGYAGATYYVNNTGIHPSIPGFRVPCYIDNITSLDDFHYNNCSIPMMVDGRTYHSIITVNDRMPGPTLIVTEGQKVIVDVHNRLTSEGVSIHWHGLHQHGTPWMDGVAFVSQAPIMPGSIFRYTFMADPAGTHWYHSHVGTQRVGGFFGALVIREKMDTREEIRRVLGNFEDIPEQHTITLFDFLRESSQSAYVKAKSVLAFFSEKIYENVPQQTDRRTPAERTTDGSELGPIPFWSGLINGRGRHSPTTYSFLSVFEVDAGKSYRFRVVGAQGVYLYKLEVVGHRLNVMASDGHLFMPVEVDYLLVHAGERYDFILTANQIAGNYLIRGQVLGLVDPSTDPSEYQFFNYTAEAVLHYNDASVPQPNPLTLYDNVINVTRGCGPNKQCVAINCPFKEFPVELNISCYSLNDLRSLFPAEESIMPDLRTVLHDNSSLFLNFGFDGNLADPSVNGRTFHLPPIPYQTYPGQFKEDYETRPLETCQYCRPVNESGSSGNCDCTQVIPIAKDRVFNRDDNNYHGHILMIFSVVTVINSVKEFHPIHLHGHNFHVVHVEHGSYENGFLRSASPHIDCGSDAKCLNPKWDRTRPPNLSKYVTKSGKLIQSAIRKDTVIVPAGGYVVVAVELNNPGYWFLHCHAEPHLFKGMATIIQEYSEDQHPKPPYGINKMGHFLGSAEELDPSTNTPRNTSIDGWKVGAIVAVVFAALGLVLGIILSIVVAKLSAMKSRNTTLHLSYHKNVGKKYSAFHNDGNSSEEMTMQRNNMDDESSSVNEC